MSDKSQFEYAKDALEEIDKLRRTIKILCKIALDASLSNVLTDPIVMINECERHGILEKVGGAAFLCGLEQTEWHEI